MAEVNFKRDTLNWGEGRVSFIEWDDGVKNQAFNLLTLLDLMR